jgi:hypothetical protein
MFANILIRIRARAYIEAPTATSSRRCVRFDPSDCSATYSKKAREKQGGSGDEGLLRTTIPREPQRDGEALAGRPGRNIDAPPLLTSSLEWHILRCQRFLFRSAICQYLKEAA